MLEIIVIKWILFLISIILTCMYWIALNIKNQLKLKRICTLIIVLGYNLMYTVIASIPLIATLWVNLSYWIICIGLIHSEIKPNNKNKEA